MDIPPQSLIKSISAWCVLAAALMCALILSLRMPIDAVSLQRSSQNMSQASIQAAISAVVKQGHVVKSLAQLVTMLQQEPWMQAVVIKRIWPHHLHIVLTEKQAIARWNGGVLDQSGHVFVPNHPYSLIELPMIHAQDDQIAAVMRLMRFFRESRTISHQELISVESLGAMGWQLVLSDGLLVFLPPDLRAEHLEKFKRALKWSKVQNPPIKKLDLRYARGFVSA